MEEKTLLNKQVKVSLETGFVLYGTLVDTEMHGIWLKSDTETSFINYSKITDIRLNKRYERGV